MTEELPIVLIPGLNCSARLYAEQIPALWPFGPITIAQHTLDETMPAIARRILNQAPDRFALVGLSMGGYIAFEIMRQAPGRVARLALLDTAATPDTPEQTERREHLMAMAAEGDFMKVTDMLWPNMVHARRQDDPALRLAIDLMAQETGAEAFIRQQTAIRGRADSRPDLAGIRCPTLVLVGDEDKMTPPERAQEMADGILDAMLVVVPECGHMSTMEQPNAVNAALIEWLQRPE